MKLSLLLPGLLAMADHIGPRINASPQLNHWITHQAQWQVHTPATTNAWWLQQFGIAHQASSPWLAQYDGITPSEKTLAMISWGHLHISMDAATWIPGHWIGLEPHDVDRLVSEISARWPGTEQWHRGQQQRTYLSQIDLPPVTLPTPEQLIGQDLRYSLSKQPNHAGWNALSNEISMLLYDLPFNEHRASSGLLPINAVLLHDTSSPAQQTPIMPTTYQHLYTHNPLAHALAKTCQLPVNTVPLSAQTLTGHSQHIVIELDHLLDAALKKDLDAGYAALQTLEQTWFTPLQTAYAQKKITALELIALDCGSTHHKGLSIQISPPAWWRQYWPKPHSKIHNIAELATHYQTQ